MLAIFFGRVSRCLCMWVRTCGYVSVWKCECLSTYPITAILLSEAEVEVPPGGQRG